MRRGKHDRKASGGLTLVELTIAMFVLVVGVLGGMMLVIIGMTRNNSNRVDTTATNIAQMVLEEIAGAPASQNPTLTVTDCLNNPLTINTAVGGPTLQSNGDVDYTQAAINGYQMEYTVCGTNGLQTPYDVRWTIQWVGTGNWAKLVTVSARQSFTTQNGIAYLPPVTLRTVISK